MSTRTLSFLLPAMLVILAVTAFIAVDFLQARSMADAGKPSFSQYIAGYVQKERAAEAGQIEKAGAMGAVPGVDAVADAEATSATAGDVVARNADSAPSSWFRGNRDDVQVKVEFTCVRGVGGSKVCTAETMKR